MSGAKVPPKFRGASPLPLQGTSFAYTFDTPKAPKQKTVQYYENMGDRAIWHDGWKAVARHTPGDDFAKDNWELYHAAREFSETHNLANQEPHRLQQMTDLWQAEAERYDVLPLADDSLSLYQNAVPPPRATYVFYPGMTRLDRLSAPDIFSYETKFVAQITFSESPASGVILASGDSSCGYEWFLEDGILNFAYVYTRNESYHVASKEPITTGMHRCGLNIRKTGESSGMASLIVDDHIVAKLELANMWPIYAANSGIRRGENRHAPITRKYSPPFVLNQRLHRVVVVVDLPIKA